MNVAVIGCFGRLGKNIVTLLEKNNIEVLKIDKNTISTIYDIHWNTKNDIPRGNAIFSITKDVLKISLTMLTEKWKYL